MLSIMETRFLVVEEITNMQRDKTDELYVVAVKKIYRYDYIYSSPYA